MRLSDITNQELLNYFNNSYYLYEALYANVHQTDEAFAQRPDKFRNTLAFYLGHTAAFTRRRLVDLGLLKAHKFDHLLERGVSPDSPTSIENKQEWPILRELVSYRRQFRNEVLDLLTRDTFNGIGVDSWQYAILMGVEHERIHLQTSMPLLTKLDPGYKNYTSIEAWSQDFESYSASDRILSVDAGEVVYGALGSVQDQVSFGWDNEFGQRRVFVDSFEVSRFPITNSDVLNFIDEGGYERLEFWDGENAFRWQSSTWNEGKPFNFVLADKGGVWHYRTVFGSIDRIPLAWPAQLNYYEAEAIARFLGGRMITEDQYMLASRGVVAGSNNAGLQRLMPVSVNNLEPFESGNVAIWTRGDFAPLETGGFQVNTFYPDFSVEWFNSAHAVLRGSTWASTGHMLDTNYRDFMQKIMHYPASTYVVY